MALARPIPSTQGRPEAAAAAGWPLQAWELGHGAGSHALTDVTFACARGETVGLVGPSGAGKTRLMRLLAGVVPAAHGRVVVGGVPAGHGHPQGACRLGYVPAGVPAYDDMPARAFVAHVAALRGLTGRARRRQVEAVVDRCGLRAAVATPVGELPAEFRLRLGVAQALVHAPEVLLLDDPLAPLDALARPHAEAWLRELVAGQTTLITARAWAGLERLCHRALCLEPGRAGVRELLAPPPTAASAGGEAGDGCLEVILDSPGGRRPPIDRLVRLFGSLAGVRRASGELGPHPATAIFRLEGVGGGVEPSLQAAAQANGLRLRRFRVHRWPAPAPAPAPALLPAVVAGMPPPWRGASADLGPVAQVAAPPCDEVH